MTRKFISVLFVIFTLFFEISAQAVDMVSVKILQRNTDTIKYIKVHGRIKLGFAVFPIASSKHSTWAEPILPETFVLSITKGRVYSNDGLIIVNNVLVKELVWPWSKLKKEPQVLDLKNLPTLKHISGKVAVITQEGHRNYYHWMTEILPKLALLEEKKIDFDWLYVPKLDLPFMRETIKLLGINPNKIIEADANTYIEADELIVPSFVSRSCYTPKWVADYLRGKFMRAVDADKENKTPLAKRIFISRSKTSYRRVINEGEVFKVLEPLGFVKYHLEDLTVSQQIALFQNAEVIVSPHGAGLTNLLFSAPGTQVIELFQQHEDDTYWYLSQTLGLKHTCIKTTKFRKNGGYTDTVIPVILIEDVVKSLKLSN